MVYERYGDETLKVVRDYEKDLYRYNKISLKNGVFSSKTLVSVYTSYATLSSGIYRAISHESLAFSGIHKRTQASVYTKTIQVTSGIFYDYATRKGCIIILYHAIENTVARWEDWV